MFTWTSYISQSAAQIGCTSSVKMNQAIKEVLFFYFFVAGSVIKKNKRESGFEKINNRLCKKAVFCHGNWSSVEVRSCFPCRQSGDKSWFRRHFIKLLSKWKVYWFAEETCLQCSGGWLLVHTPWALVPSGPSFLFLLLFSFWTKWLFVLPQRWDRWFLLCCPPLPSIS